MPGSAREFDRTFRPPLIQTDNKRTRLDLAEDFGIGWNFAKSLVVLNSHDATVSYGKTLREAICDLPLPTHPDCSKSRLQLLELSLESSDIYTRIA
jgi:hypothetical protein